MLYNLPNATHPVFILNIRELQVPHRPSNLAENQHSIGGTLRLTAEILGGVAPPGYSPTAMALAPFASKEQNDPWVLCPMSMLGQVHAAVQQEREALMEEYNRVRAEGDALRARCGLPPMQPGPSPENLFPLASTPEDPSDG